MIQIKNLIITLILIIFSSIALSNETNGNQFNSALLEHPQNRENEIILTSIPMDFYKSVESFTVTWIALSELDLTAYLYISNSPGGSELNNYIQTTVSGIGEITTTPEEIGYDVGLYYAVIGNPITTSASIEFQLIIESQQSVQMVSPMGDITTTTPLFSWDPTPGVPYYHVILSDNPFVLAEDEDGNMTVSGAQAIWQIITPETSVQYGDFDPSGSFENTAPPLVPGLTYNWLVMNNYGNSLLYSSQVASTPVEFEYISEVTLDSPEQIYPEFSLVDSPIEIDGEEIITFQWSEVDGAMTYQIFLSELRLEAGSEIQYPIWNQVTTNNLIDFSASSILINAKYAWKIIASNSDGVSSISELSYFNYNIPFGRIHIYAKVGCGEGDCGVGYASATIDPIDGSGDVVPITVDATGHAYKNLPLGSYLLTVEKPGFEIAAEFFELVYNPDFVPGSDSQIGASDFVNVIVQMEWSPGSIYGVVQNSEGIPIESAIVIAINSEGEERSSNVSGGGYSLSVIPDVWTIYAQKEGYESVNFFQYSISGGQNFEAENLILQENIKNITGSVSNSTGIPLSGVIVTAIIDNASRQEITNASGNYSFEGVSIGEWVISAEKIGYYSPPALQIDITELSNENTQAENISLTPQANIVNGNVNNTVVGIADVAITATPSSGLPISTNSDSYGNYSLNLPEGNYQFSANMSNYSSQNIHSLILTVAETIDGINFILIPNESYIEGKITSEDVGISGVLVSTNESSDLSDNFGNYSLSVTPGTYEVNIQKTGYSSSGVEIISIGAGQIISNIDFELNANASTITGVVYANGSTVYGADIVGKKIIYTDENNNNIWDIGIDEWLLSVDISSVFTSTNGGYQLDLLPGSYIIWADKNNFITNSSDSLYLNIQAGQSVSGQDIILTAFESQINGSVLKENGEALRNANVIISELGQSNNEISTVTNIQGEYSVIVSPEKSYSITVSKDGYSSETYTTENDLEISQVIQFNSVLVALPGSIEGLVMDNEENLIANATILISNEIENYESQTGIYGYYSVNIADGEYNISIEKLGYLSTTSTITVLPGQELENNFVLEQNFSSLSGIIQNNFDGSGLENVSVIATRSSGGGGTTHTNENGEFILNGLLPGAYSIQYELTGYQSVQLENEYLPGGINLDISTNLVPFIASISVNTNNNLNSLSGVTVSIENQSSGELLSETSNILGISEFIGLSSNSISYLVTASKVNYYASPQLITLIPETNEYSIEFDLQLISSKIIGMVVNSDDTSIGLNNVNISAISLDGFSGQSITDASGNYEIQNLNPGREYEITVTKDGYTLLSTTSVNLNSEIVELENIEMIPNNRTISGKVKNQNNEYLEEVNILLEAIGFNLISNTNINGEYLFSNLAPNEDYYLSTQSVEEGWETVEAMISIAEEPSIEVEDFIIHINGSEINGIVDDENNNDMLMGVQFTATNLDNFQVYSTTSQPNGSFNLDKLSAGNYQITATLEFYESIVFNISVGELESVIYNLSLVFNQPLTISGIVIDTDDRTYPNVPLTLINNEQSLNTFSDSLGNFLFNDIYPNRIFSISTGLSNDYYLNNSIQNQLENSNLSNIEIEIDVHTSSIELLIKDSNENNLEGVNVDLLFNQDSLYSGLTSENGQINFNQLYEGNYLVNLTKSGYYDNSSSVIALEDDSVYTNEILMVPKEGAVGGLIYTNYLSNDFSLFNVMVELSNDEGVIDLLNTNELNSFEFEGLLHNGNYILKFSKMGYEDFEINFTFDENSPQSFSIPMIISPNTIVGFVVNDGSYINNVGVHARDLDGFVISTITDENGEFVINGVSGYFDVWAGNDDNSLISPYIPVALSSGGSGFVELVLNEASKIIGTISYNNSGVSGVSVSAENINTGALVSIFSTDDGGFEIPGMQIGNYNLIVFKEGYSVIGTLPSISITNLGIDYNVDSIEMTFVNNSLSGNVINMESGIGILDADIFLFDENGTELANSISDAGGGFLFSGLIDGEYSLIASHPGYLDLTSQVDVSLIGGISNPIIIELETKSFTIFGIVLDDNSQFLSEANISLYSADTLISSIESNGDGQYLLDNLQVGNYQVLATKENYDSSYSNITLTNINNVVERNLFLLAKPGSISGEMEIYNNSSAEGYVVELQSTVVTLKDLISNQIFEYTLNNNNRSFYFNELNSSNYELSIESEIGVFLDNSLNDVINFNNQIEFNLIIAEDKIHNFEFIYNANSVNLSGVIQMQEAINDSEFVYYEVESGSISIGSTETEITNGQYQIYNLELGSYDIVITAEFDNEVFNYSIEDYNLLNAGNHSFNYNFDYVLPKLVIKLTEDGITPIPSATVQIISDRAELTLITDENGECETLPEMHTNTEYIVNIIKNSGTIGQFIPVSPFSVWFESLANFTIEEQLPLQFNLSQLEPLPATDSINLNLDIASSYNGNINLFFTNVSNATTQYILDSNGEISFPAQGQSGVIQFYFTSQDNSGMNYSNISQPFSITLTSEGLLSEASSSIMPVNPIFAYGQESQLELNLFDDIGNSLNNQIESIIWTLTNPNLGGIVEDAIDPTIAHFIANTGNGDDITGEVRATITQNLNGSNITIQLSNSILVKNLILTRIQVSGPDKLENDQSGFFAISATDSSGITMNANITAEPLEEWQGVIEIVEGGIQFIPHPNLIGKVELLVNAEDANTGNIINGIGEVEVYEQITPTDPATFLNGGHGFILEIPEGMLKPETGSAELSLNASENVPSLKASSATSSLASAVINIKSNKPETAFNYLPGLSFNSSGANLNEPKIAYWDNNRLIWVELDEFGQSQLNRSSTTELSISEIPGWNEYALLSSSDPLGIYDMEIRPNPFTPNSDIGTMIAFRLSSDVGKAIDYTATIYNLNGTKIRSLVRNLNVPKENCSFDNPINESMECNPNECCIRWNGKTDSGEIARNGKYIVRIQVKDSNGKKEIVKPVVLFK
jgi:hypothetical protein